VNYLLAESLSKSYGIKTLFENISFSVDKGQKIALVAKNGTGKTSLLKILVGQDTPDKGTLYLRKEITTSLLEQEPDLDENATILEAVFHNDTPVMKATRQYEYALEHTENDLLMQQAFEAMEQSGAWDFDAKVKTVLSQLQIHHLDSKIKTLSGGQKKRVALAKVLLEEPDFLIMDEPTNHLDLDMIEWLEDYLDRANMTLLMVTHDRYFLENVCNVILELDKGILYRHKGNYSYYLEKKATREENEKSNLVKTKNLFRSELEWIRKQPRARGTKAKSRVNAFQEIKQKASKKIDEEKLQINIDSKRIGGKILELHHLKKSFGDKKIINDFSYKFKDKERIGVVGKNGAGKTTLLHMLTGKAELDGGKIVKGETVHIGYYTQDGMKLKEDKRVIEVLKDIAEFIPLKGGKVLSASQLLETFLFEPESQYTFVSKLSGGEKRRLYLLTILISNPNFLILDEPTNDLDVLTLQVLEDFLDDFPGCVLIVSHDRYFMDRLTQHLFVFEGEGVISDFTGTYTEYRIIQELKAAEKYNTPKETKPKEDKPKPVTSEKRKLSYKEQREFEQLEKDIPELENKKTKLTEILSSGKLNSDEFQKTANNLGYVVSQLEAKELRWLELSELI
jgi:ABC transport system ATP-binding/permease protein